jgi:hypothetical protein
VLRYPQYQQSYVSIDLRFVGETRKNTDASGVIDHGENIFDLGNKRLIICFSVTNSYSDEYLNQRCISQLSKLYQILLSIYFD